MSRGRTASAAAPLDRSAAKKTDEAMQDLYTAGKYPQTESQLAGILKACQDKCSSPVKARIWMYIGIVRGTGKKDQKTAREAFEAALALDPQVPLDRPIADAQTRETFDQAAEAAPPQPPAE